MSFIKVTIDNIEVEVEPGTTILNAARKIGGDVAPPAMCYYSTLKNSGGKCRTCLVEVAAGSTAEAGSGVRAPDRRARHHRTGAAHHADDSPEPVLGFRI